jgi:hypothetical protein
VRKNKTMKGGMFGAMLAAAAQQAAAQQAAARAPAAYPQQAPPAAGPAPNLSFLSRLPPGIISPQSAAALQTVAQQNPQALASLAGGVKGLAPHVGNFLQSATPFAKQFVGAAIQNAPLPAGQKMLLNAGLNVGSKVLPGATSFAYNQAMKNPQQALQTGANFANMLSKSGNFKF